MNSQSDSRATQQQLTLWIQKSLENENFADYKITTTGSSDKGDGYASHIVFVTIQGTTKEQEPKTLHLVIKHGKNNDYVRNTLPMRMIFETEIYMYAKVFPVLRKFQLEKGVKDGFDSVPKCYNTLIFKNMEVLVFDNLRIRGYTMHDRTRPMNFSHLSLLLEKYAKYHALCFAFKDQKRGEFLDISSNLRDGLAKLFETEVMKEMMLNMTDKAFSILEERNDQYLLQKFKRLLYKNPLDILLDLIKNEEPETVIVHGDCWNNNFLFKYKRGNVSEPAEVAILDWQISAVRSPVYDLTYVIYANSSAEALTRFEELLEIYYKSLSKFIKELGSDPETLFPLSSLRRHWKKYSVSAVIFTTLALPFTLGKMEDAPALEGLQEGQTFTLDVADEQKDLYYERLAAVLHHHFDYDFAI